jgi:hypothetical protein
MENARVEPETDWHRKAAFSRVSYPINWLNYFTCVEAGVVAARKSDHNLPPVLDNLIVGDGVLAQDIRGDHAHLVPETNQYRVWPNRLL